MLEWIRIVVEWIIHLNAALVNSSLGRTQHKERRTSHLLEFAVGAISRNALLPFSKIPIWDASNNLGGPTTHISIVLLSSTICSHCSLQLLATLPKVPLFIPNCHIV